MTMEGGRFMKCIFIILTTLLSAYGEVLCPTLFTRHGSRCYLATTSFSHNKAGALSFCTSNGAELVNINNEAEYLFIVALLPLDDRAWLINLGDSQQEGNHKWGDGSSHFPNPPWGSDEPNNCFQGVFQCFEEDCVVLVSEGYLGKDRGAYLDIPCDRDYGAICERTGTCASGEVMCSDNSNCYHPINNKCDGTRECENGEDEPAVECINSATPQRPAGARSCAELEFNGFNTNGYYYIDPDGAGNDGPVPLRAVYCEFAANEGFTKIGNNADQGDLGQPIPSRHLTPQPGTLCVNLIYSQCPVIPIAITYDNSWTVGDLGVLCDNSATCSQTILYACLRMFSSNGRSRDGDLYNCCGQPGDTGLTECTCTCNLNLNTGQRVVEELLVTYKHLLPVSSLELQSGFYAIQNSFYDVSSLVASGTLCTLQAVTGCYLVTCISATSQECLRCEGDYANEGSAYTITDDKQTCIKQCSWRPDSNVCYPGTCVDFNCVCQTGFSDLHCLKIEPPPILYRLGKLTLGDLTTTVESPLVQDITIDITDTVYTNTKDIAKITVDWRTSFMPELPDPTPKFLEDIDIGIISANLYVEFKGIPVLTIPTVCPNSGTPTVPITDVLECVLEFNLDVSSATDNDKLTCTVDALNGGKIDVFDRDNNDETISRMFSGTKASKELSWTFDFLKPTHCGGVSGCTETLADMLYVGDDVTTEADITYTFSGWTDALSGIKKYDYQVWELTNIGEELVEDPTAAPVLSGSEVSSGQMLTLPQVTAVFSFVLNIHDYSKPDPGNVQRTRRFILLDAGDTSITTQAVNPFRVTSATSNTSYMWQVEVASSGPTQVTLDWTGYFINVEHHTKGLLNSIADYILPLSSEYDQGFGIRGRDAIQNALGIVQFRVFMDKDHMGGTTIESPTETDRNAWLDEGINTNPTYDPQLADGDSARYWLWATDIIGQTNEVEVLVHFDSSPPEIAEFGLEYDGQTEIFVHSMVELNTMKVTFQSWDIHSGLKSIQWRLYDNFTGTELEHSSGAVPVVQLEPDSCTVDVLCECRPLGECYKTDYTFMPLFSTGVHDHDYFITLTITNNAEVFITPTIKVSVDTSAPEIGAVHDGMAGSNEIDYQSDLALHAHWQGFFDKESGIIFYEYIFDTKCWAEDDWESTIRMNMIRTVDTFSTLTASEPGKYYVTVVAFNRAIDPSEPVCSDGVVIDTSNPMLGEIFLAKVKLRPGILKDINNDVFYVDSMRYIYILEDASDECRNKIPAVTSDVESYPSTTDSVPEYVASDTDCELLDPIDEITYISTDRHIALSWVAVDSESGIFDYEVGLGSVADNPIPDLVPYRPTARHSDFTFYHTNVGQDSEFYIFVKAINKAQLSTVKIIGPILVDTTPPVFTGEISLAVEDGFLIGSWAEGDFADIDGGELEYFIAIGHTAGGTETFLYKPLNNYISGPCLQQDYCAAVSTEELDWDLHEDHVYYLSVRAENTAGLAVFGTSIPYYHSGRLPTKGVVIDESPSTIPGIAFSLKPDIDSQTDTESLTARWYGFQHPYEDLTFKFAIGTQPGIDDITGEFIDVGSAMEHTQSGLNLILHEKYFTTIRAVGDVGSVDVSSDGVLILQDNFIPTGATIADGIGCQAFVQEPTVGMIHQNVPYVHGCEEDTSYQVSTSYAQAHWTIPDALLPIVTHVVWTLEEMLYDELDDPYWSNIMDNDLGLATEHTEAGLFLQTGRRYRSTLTFCFENVCSQAIESDWFLILSQPPAIGSITVTNFAKAGIDQTDIDVTFQTFTHEYVEDNTLTSDNLMDFYEWSLMDEAGSDGSLYAWERIESADLNIVDNQASFTASYSKPFSKSECLYIKVRGYNNVGLFNIATTEVFDCSDPAERIVSNVLDSSDPVNFVENAPGPFFDNDYTSDSTRISALWPNLKYPSYEWAIIADTGTDASLDTGLKYPCDHVGMVDCGYTEQEAINADNLELMHGQLYRMCIHANSTDVEFEGGRIEKLDEIAECSDGIIADFTPPVPGRVWIIHEPDNAFQVSSTELIIHWESFIDVEEEGMALHHSGIQCYEYAIGTGSGTDDIVEFRKISVTNQVTVRGLTLQNGYKYYATIRATDFVGLSSNATSEAIRIDNVPPVVLSDNVDVGGDIIRSPTSVTAKWAGVFFDDVSGVQYYEWGIGSLAGHSDIMPFTYTISDEDTSDSGQPLTLQDGHSYFITIKATDYLGQTTSQSFGAYLVDTSPPTAGHVYDGTPSSDQNDQDYQIETTSLRARWDGFYDPHSDIKGFTWKIGRCKDCDDVMQEQFVGKDNDVSADNLNLIPGFIYYTTVTACNAADDCTSVTSDGILIDNSPPTRGRVRDGCRETGELDYQTSRIFLSAHWWGFNDPHSPLSHYEWWAGTTKGAEDILSKTKLHIAEDALAILQDDMPEDTPIFITVRAWNRAGLYSEGTSDGFKIDTTPPVVDMAPTINDSVGVLTPDTQVLRSTLGFKWSFIDDESGILWHLVSVSTHQNGESDLPNIKLNGGDKQVTFANITLHDGSVYEIRVFGCNGARHCTESFSSLTVDSSPPTVGTFAVNTAHSPNLQRHLAGWMSWHTDAGGDYIKLAWLGFADCHTSIVKYYVTVGSTYATSDLTENDAILIDHNPNGDDSETGEGPIQTATIPISGTIANLAHIFIALWAVNGVGLSSPRLHSAFELGSSGNPNEGHLILIRGTDRCMIESCAGHCVCAPLGELCMTSRECTDQTLIGYPNTEIRVFDVIDLSFPPEDIVDIDFTPSRCMLAAQWRVIFERGLPIVRYEWSAGVNTNEENPLGIFDPSEDRVWYDSELDTYAVLMLEKERELMVSVTYEFFVRAWYDDDTFAVFRSDGLTPDITPPITTTSLGAKVKDLPSPSATKDVDFVTDISAGISASWGFVFFDESDIYYEIALGTEPGVDDIAAFQHLSDGPFSTSVKDTLTGLSLLNGVRYFISVRAINAVGLYTTRSSDGFTIDGIPPAAGIVRDGLGLHDVEYQNSTTLVSASWHGFLDLESFIDHYMWCVGTDENDPTEASVVPCISVGLKLNAFKKLTTPLNNGDTVYSKVYAVDAANQVSSVVISDGSTVDSSPPVPHQLTVNTDNALLNPSFENVATGGVAVPDLDGILSDSDARPESWLVDADSNCAVVTPGDMPVQDGLSFAALKGRISQSFSTIPGVRYQITLYVSHIDRVHNPLRTQEGCIEVVDDTNDIALKKIFQLYNRPLVSSLQQDMPSVYWMFHQYIFKAEKDSYTLALSSFGVFNGILIDNIQVNSMSFEVPSDPATPLVSVGKQFIHDWSSIHGHWQFLDAESPVLEHRWAIGTVKGGTQVQSFVSVGTNTYAYSSDLYLQHGSTIFVTVTAENAAELTGLAYSGPVVIDTTPPVIKYVYDGEVSGTDIQFQSTQTIRASWMSEDPDSGIENCVWFVGRSPGISDLKDPVASTTPLSDFVQADPSDLKETLANSDIVYVTVRCQNNAGLVVEKPSNGVAILIAGPNSQSAVIHFINPSETQYSTRSSTQSQTASSLVAWEGFYDPLGVVKYECKLALEDGDGVWSDCGSGNDTSVHWNGHQFMPGNSYVFSIRAVNYADGVSSEINDGFSIATEMPVLIEQVDELIRFSWLSNIFSCTDPVCRSDVFFSWEDVFPDDNLIYVISMGNVEGGANILNWVETTNSYMGADNIVVQDLYISVTAVNTAGLYRTIRHTVNLRS